MLVVVCFNRRRRRRRREGCDTVLRSHICSSGANILTHFELSIITSNCDIFLSSRSIQQFVVVSCIFLRTVASADATSLKNWQEVWHYSTLDSSGTTSVSQLSVYSLVLLSSGENRFCYNSGQRGEG